MTVVRSERAERILRAAMHLFHERGFNAVGVDLIGERAGMSGPAIYRHFASKDAILVTLVDDAIDKVLLATAGVHDDPFDELRHLVRMHVQRVLEERELMSIWIKERNAIPKKLRPRLRSRIDRYMDRWFLCLDRCYPGNPRPVLVTAVHAIHGLIDSAATWPEEMLSVDGTDDVLTGIAMAGFGWLGDQERPVVGDGTCRQETI
ncbi:TetR/AcrR family transcriptional regulator [Mycolicibacterium fortuitum]|uniref:TetR/AcrR family transcriptional regulator n=1 Tax=Mycolicibacterium fortuitum TaxID=1766 RepID=UPI0013F62158|nr:TetR/AcrR family transcriptional regulator [Mycolicibacterium fortuitum]